MCYRWFMSTRPSPQLSKRPVLYGHRSPGFCGQGFALVPRRGAIRVAPEEWVALGRPKGHRGSYRQSGDPLSAFRGGNSRFFMPMVAPFGASLSGRIWPRGQRLWKPVFGRWTWSCGGTKIVLSLLQIPQGSYLPMEPWQDHAWFLDQEAHGDRQAVTLVKVVLGG